MIKMVYVSIFSVCSVWFGGYVCDLCGGYRGGGQQRVAVRVTTLFAGNYKQNKQTKEKQDILLLTNI